MTVTRPSVSTRVRNTPIEISQSGALGKFTQQTDLYSKQI